MREALKECKEWIEHWQADRESGFPPTKFSIDRLHEIVTRALAEEDEGSATTSKGCAE